MDTRHSSEVAILDALRADHLLVDGHFAFRSGRHSATLIDRDRLLANPAVTSRMGYALAKQFFTAHIDTIAAPSIWGAGLAQWVAYFLEPRASVVYATPIAGIPTIADNLRDLIAGRRVLLIDNLVISGETITRFAQQLVDYDADVVGLGTLWNSGEPTVAGREVVSLLNGVIPTHLAGACPRCGEVPMTPVEVVNY